MYICYIPSLPGLIAGATAKKPVPACHTRGLAIFVDESGSAGTDYRRTQLQGRLKRIPLLLCAAIIDGDVPAAAERGVPNRRRAVRNHNAG